MDSVAEKSSQDLVAFAETNDWDATCEYAEANFPALHDHLETWGAHCGAPREVYRGQLVVMLLMILTGKT